MANAPRQGKLRRGHISLSAKSAAKDGKDRNGNQRYRCKLCSARFIETAPKPLGDMRITLDQASTILGMLLEGMAVRAVSRLTGVCKHTICELIVLVGENCQRFLPQAVNGVAATDVQCDELWSFVTMKERQRHRGNFTGEEGDSWTWLAIDRYTKLILTHHVGQRDGQSSELAGSQAGRVRQVHLHEKRAARRIGRRCDLAHLAAEHLVSSHPDRNRLSHLKPINQRLPDVGFQTQLTGNFQLQQRSARRRQISHLGQLATDHGVERR